MNVLFFIELLDGSPLVREIRNGGVYGDILTFYNESDFEVNLMVDNINYFNVLQVCLILKDHSYYIYIQQYGNTNLVKLDIDSIEEISCFL